MILPKGQPPPAEGSSAEPGSREEAEEPTSSGEKRKAGAEAQGVSTKRRPSPESEVIVLPTCSSGVACKLGLDTALIQQNPAPGACSLRLLVCWRGARAVLASLQAGVRHPVHIMTTHSRQRPPLQQLGASMNHAAGADKESLDAQKTVQVHRPCSLKLLPQ